MTIHIVPSQYVRASTDYRVWCSITVCEECGLRAKYEDCHPANPCPNCGGKVKETVGKWVTTVKPVLFGLLRKERGYWLLRKEQSI